VQNSRLAYFTDVMISDEFNKEVNGSHSVYRLFYTVKVINHIEGVEKEFDSSFETLVKQAVVSFLKLEELKVHVTWNDSKALDAPYTVNILLSSPTPISALDFQKSIMAISDNKQKCSFENDTLSVVCMSSTIKDIFSLQRISKYWVDLCASTLPENLSLIEEEQLFAFKPVWLIGLIVIACVLALFFLGCVIAICYTRRPYRKSAKVYEFETAARKSSQIAQAVEPKVKTAALTKNNPSQMHY